jgi:hypothetical protein
MSVWYISANDGTSQLSECVPLADAVYSIAGPKGVEIVTERVLYILPLFVHYIVEQFGLSSILFSYFIHNSCTPFRWHEPFYLGCHKIVRTLKTGVGDLRTTRYRDAAPTST